AVVVAAVCCRKVFLVLLLFFDLSDSFQIGDDGLRFVFGRFLYVAGVVFLVQPLV
ncbi:MAG: hypothetical protein JWR40_2714, partial [Massilia sp.]|nr:hypothetical protein [Massilia sp.]